ncbi:hypothetical protein AgCh_009981 [Apium graveolens]
MLENETGAFEIDSNNESSDDSDSLKFLHIDNAISDEEDDEFLDPNGAIYDEEEDSTWSLNGLKATVKPDMKYEMSMFQAWKVKNKAMKLLKGDDKDDAEVYVDDCYKKDTLLGVYSFKISPPNGHELWPDSENHELVPPIIEINMLTKKNKV